MLAEFHEASGGLRFVVLINRLGISRDSLTTTLAALFDMNLVMKNPGYGHPMRPEYVLTAGTDRLAEACYRYVEAIGDNEVFTRKWTAPVLLTLMDGQSRFNEIRTNLGITPRALTQTLRQLEQHGSIERSIDDGYPPTTSYRLNPGDQKISQAVDHIRSCVS